MVLAITGGGSRAIADLLAVPGGSRTLLEAIVPYSAEALAEFLHGQPEKFCSPRTARAMAMAAFQRARHLKQSHLGPGEHSGDHTVSPAIGIGCTASLTSDRPKRGPHRIHVALQTAKATVTHSLELVKGRRVPKRGRNSRRGMVLNAVAEALDIDERLLLPLDLGEHVRIDPHRCGGGRGKNLLLGRVKAVRHPAIRLPKRMLTLA